LRAPACALPLARSRLRAPACALPLARWVASGNQAPGACRRLHFDAAAMQHVNLFAARQLDDAQLERVGVTPACIRPRAARILPGLVPPWTAAAAAFECVAAGAGYWCEVAYAATPLMPTFARGGCAPPTPACLHTSLNWMELRGEGRGRSRGWRMLDCIVWLHGDTVTWLCPVQRTPCETPQTTYGAACGRAVLWHALCGMQGA
jgi:hypothetical protein